MSEVDDYVLRWPRDLLRVEVTTLVNEDVRTSEWSDRCQLLLEQAFVDASARDAFVAAQAPTAPVSLASFPQGSRRLGGREPGGAFLLDLLRRVDSLPEEGARVPYYSQRVAGASANVLSLSGAVREFARLVDRLDSQGYFDRDLGKECPDDDRIVDPSGVLLSMTGIDGLWPVPGGRMVEDRELLFDVIEVLHDVVAAPRSRWIHNYGGCGAHYSNFSTRLGRGVYTWLVNRILDRAELGLRLAEDGEDRGRLVAVDDDHAELVQRMVERSDPTTRDEVRHAIALFRARGAGEQEKRSACIALAGVLESRRDLLKEKLVKKDEGMLFELANNFGIRHRRPEQRSDYDPVFLDWVFWFYLATVELSDRLLAREAVAEEPLF